MQSAHSPVTSCSRSPQRSYIQPGYHQNLSGSDTDVSTSTENLTAEERKVLQNGVRQEPQGEETISDDVDTISSNTLIIHDTKSFGEHDSPFYSQMFNVQGKSTDASLIQALERDNKEKYNRLYSEFSENTHLHPFSCRNTSSGLQSSPKNSISNTFYNGIQKSPMNTWDQHPNEYSMNANQNISSFHSPPGSYHLMSNMNSYPESHPAQGITEIPKDYLDQSEVLKYLAKELNHQNYLTDISNYSPVPDYSKIQSDYVKDHTQMFLGNSPRRRGLGMTNMKSKSAERLSVSRSHPDLSHVKHYHSEDNSANASHLIQRPDIHGRLSVGNDSEVSTVQANQMVELLSAENTALKTELDLYYKKVSKLQKFELEIQKVHKAHEDLVRSTEKRENLERAIRAKLEMEIRRLQDHNKELRDQLESATSHFTKQSKPVSDVNDSEVRKELSKREVLIAQLLTQTKELLAEKERQEIELQAQRATLQEQRNHIDILDNALTNAQANVVRLEEESRKKQVYVDRVAQLQKALTSLQQSSEKRLLVEKKLRAQLEKEVQALKLQKQGRSSSLTKVENSDSTESLKKTVMEYEEKIIGLEAEVSKWEQRYIEESTMRQIAVDAASVPKDAKIAALERTSQESEKLIAQARTEKLKQMDELYAANRKCAELESRIKDFESKLAEKDAMIKVLQQHSQEKDAVLQHAVLGRPPRHTRSASTAGLTTSSCHTTTTTGVSSLGRISPSPTSLGRISPSPTNSLHRKTGSKVECGNSGLSISSESSSSALPSQSSPVTESVTASKKSLDEQLKELDSRLSRLHHKRSTSRERKVSKSLLESMKEMICN
ncbi:LOW QUALITY PROTEIN: angiomotin-like [Uloborus diversus]|uniref:LOW QUALITY PROTEIN: angiomotin-like n=1 Tax=Uloborus diversus TaxID=327109 RepID=UPI0024090CC4|nr:LOW QUALITY PROTEIN: angiomotin-like [Uloborus diversus]